MVLRVNVGSTAVSPNLLRGASELERAGQSEPVFAHNMGAASKAVMEAGSCLSERRTTSARRRQQDSLTALKRPSGNNACAMRDAPQNIAIVPTLDLNARALPTITTASGELSADVECQKGQLAIAYGIEGGSIVNMARDVSELVLTSSVSSPGQALDQTQSSVEWGSAHEQTGVGSVQSIAENGSHAGTPYDANEELLTNTIPGVLESLAREAAPSKESNLDRLRSHAVALDKRTSGDATRERDDMKLVQPPPKELGVPNATASPNHGDISGRTVPTAPDAQDDPTSQMVPAASAYSRINEGISDDDRSGHTISIVRAPLLHGAEDGGNAWTADSQVAASNQQHGGQSTSVEPIGYMPNYLDGAKASGSLGANGKEAGKSANSRMTRLGPNVQQTADQSGGKTITDGSESVGDQTKHYSSMRTQVAQDQTNVLVVPISVGRESAAIFAPATTPVDGTAAYSSPKTSDGGPALSSGASSQVTPLINTAKLIHVMGQSEIRVGMSSAEFGNISISTLTTRDMTSAVIALDHSELAKVIATHLPEMQARLGGVLPANVRIDTNSAGSSQEASTFSSASHGSRDGSPAGNRHAGRANPSHLDNSIPRGLLVEAIVTPSSTDGRNNSYLDIRV